MTNRILVVEQRQGRSDMLVESLLECKLKIVGRMSVEDSFLSQIERLAPELIILDVTQPTESIIHQLQVLFQTRPTPVVFFADETDSRFIDAIVDAGVSVFVVNGMQMDRIESIIKVAIARFKAQYKLYQELEQTKSKLQERKTIDRAKGIIMKQRNLSEDEAYATLRTTAMKQNKRIIVVAKEIIGVAELLF